MTESWRDEIRACKFCFSEMRRGKLNLHVARCKDNPNRYVRPKRNKLEISGRTRSSRKGSVYKKTPTQCSLCFRSFNTRNSLGCHFPFCLKNPDRIRRKTTFKGRVAPSDQTRQKMSESAKKRGLGGITQSRWVHYKGKLLGSSYELKVAISLDENFIQWDTCSKFKYKDPNGRSRTYTPDFYLPEYDVYLDPKNDFLLNNVNPALGFTDREKIQLASDQNAIRVIVLSKEELSWYFIKTKLPPSSSNGRIPVL